MVRAPKAGYALVGTRFVMSFGLHVTPFMSCSLLVSSFFLPCGAMEKETKPQEYTASLATGLGFGHHTYRLPSVPSLRMPCPAGAAQSLRSLCAALAPNLQAACRFVSPSVPCGFTPPTSSWLRFFLPYKTTRRRKKTLRSPAQRAAELSHSLILASGRWVISLLSAFAGCRFTSGGTVQIEKEFAR